MYLTEAYEIVLEFNKKHSAVHNLLNKIKPKHKIKPFSTDKISGKNLLKTIQHTHTDDGNYRKKLKANGAIV